jgi:hypothetical protein
LAHWVRRFGPGTVRVAGCLRRPVPLGESAQVLAGRTWLHLDFHGGAEARIVRAVVSGRVRDAGRAREGAEAEGGPEGWTIDGFPLSPLETGLAAWCGAVIDQLEDAELAARALVPNPIELCFAAGLRLEVPAGREVWLRGQLTGPPEAPRLRTPVVLAVEGEGLRLRLPGPAWLGGAEVRLAEAALHPDGSVQLEGGASGTLDRWVRSGLPAAARALSSMVRTSPRFERVRGFLV